MAAGDPVATVIYPAISNRQIKTVLYSGWYLVDRKGKVARYEVVLTKLLKLPAWNLNG